MHVKRTRPDSVAAKWALECMMHYVRTCVASLYVPLECFLDIILNSYCYCFRTTLKLESLEDAVVLDDPEEDLLQDKRGCPAYVSPEILRAHRTYSGRAADMWSLGVILYTMLVGRCVSTANYYFSKLSFVV